MKVFGVLDPRVLASEARIGMPIYKVCSCEEDFQRDFSKTLLFATYQHIVLALWDPFQEAHYAGLLELSLRLSFRLPGPPD